MDALHEKRRRFVRRQLESELALTQRDLAILLDLYTNRFMNTRQLQALYGDRIFRRLHLLFHHGYIDRPKAGRIWRIREGGGSKPIIYAISSQGARALAALRLIDEDRRDFSERNRELSDFSLLIPHELGVADVRVAFQRSCLARPDLRLGQADELARGQDARALEVPGENRSLIPDWNFFIVGRYRALSDASLFFLERDRGTEPNVRRVGDDLESLKRKYQWYLSYARAKRHVEQFGVNNFRVLTVVSGGDTKMRNVAKTAYEVSGGVGASRFLVTNSQTLSEQDPLTLPWLNAAQQTTTLSLSL